MILYRGLVAVDSLVGLIFLYFFFVGLGDGSVSSFNMGLWLATLGAIAATIGGGLALGARGRRGPANLMLALLAVPAILFGLFMLIVIVANPRWN